MEFVNFTPFGAAAYCAIDVHDNEYDVVVVRTVYRLRADPASGQSKPNWLLADLIVDEAPGLVTEDCYSGEVGKSSVLVESDLAPFKPRCDVIVSGHTFAPFGQPADGWLARLRISQPVRHPDAADTSNTPQPLRAEDEPDFENRVRWQQAQQAHRSAWDRAPGPQGELVRRLLLDKALRVHAPRYFEAGSQGEWALRQGAPVLKVPLQYELAYGGGSVVANPRADREPDQPPHCLNEVNYTNPLGCGWWHADHFAALQQAGWPRPERLPAPQFEYPNDPVQAPDFTPQTAGLGVPEMQQQALSYAHRAAGFGAVGRAWTPRIQAAGTHDQAWLDTRWPKLPADFDMSYWNGAPADQQMAFPESDLYLELGNLIEPVHCATGHAVLQLPGHRASVLFRLESGLLLGGPCVIDTLHLHTDRMQLSVTWRASLARSMQARVAELRFQLDPAAPLLDLPPSAAKARPPAPQSARLALPAELAR